VFPSVYDTSSLVQIEAATNKTPTLFIKDTTTSGDVQDNIDGFLCEENEEIFANKIIEIFKDKEKLAKISEQAYQNLHISWDDVVKKVEERYEFLLNEKVAK
jgi:glycosyltransferase involved in cell wall biosynthesis